MLQPLAIAVIGGAQIYAQMLERADRLVLTRVHLRPDGDTKFPPIDPQVWKEAGREEHQPGPQDQAGFTTLVYERVDTPRGEANRRI